MMIETLRINSRVCYQELPKLFSRRKDWLFGNYPAQCIVSIECIKW